MEKTILFYQLLKRVSVWLLVLLGSTVAFTASAQCPVAAGCTPGGAPASNHIFGMGIFNVTFGSINNSTAGVAQGYQNYSCTQGTALTAGVSYPISISTNINVNENVRVWIDYNNNGQFDATNELAFLSDNKKLHTGNIIVPATAVTGTPLRMRVAADYVAAPLPTPCSTPQYSQTEDYKVTVSSNASAPDAAFSADLTTTCTGSVTFSDLSQNLPTSWSWNFGDGSAFSTIQNPTHTYSTPGTYTVTLIACNATGCDTITKTNYITYNDNVPRAASCTPVASSYCCNYGITNFTFATLSNASANGSVGYEDFTCTKAVTITEGMVYTTTITTGTANNHDVRIYIDYNNDGNFAASERVFEALNTTNPTGSVTIAGGAVLNTPLRMRVIADFAGSTFTGCSGLTHGQAEDYTITLLQNTNPPATQFTSNHTTTCDTIVQFTDQTTNAPTSWKWYFGDGDSSSLQNPVHRYTTSGMYDVTLITCNSFGCDTLVKINSIAITLPCIIYCQSDGHRNTSTWISNVLMGGINNATVAEMNGYGNYTGLIGSATIGSNASITISSNNSFFKTYTVWIDYNRNGTFETLERVVAGTNSLRALTSNFIVPASAMIGPTRMRVMIRSGSVTPTPCLVNQFNAEVEDYTIFIGSNSLPPVANFSAANTSVCNGTADFFDQSFNGATSWSWDFGDGSTSTLQNPSHTYSAQGNYTVTLTACNSNGCNTTVKSNYIRYDTAAAACSIINMPVAGKVPVVTRCTGTIFDSGGATGFYSDNEDGVVTIAPAGAGSVRLDFSSFDLENCCDRLQIFNGPTINSPLIGEYRGTALPNGGTVISTSGAITLRMLTDGSSIRSGFSATFTCIPATSAPTAAFSADLNSICTGIVPFTNISANGATSWQWNFGDGNTSTQPNPTHTYQTTTPATYDVTLIACNAFGCDTITQTNYINITVPCLNYCPSNGHTNTSQWISNVTFGTVNNTSSQDPNGYGNYTNLSSSHQIATTNNFSVDLGNTSTMNVGIWIDFNHDGIFQTHEEVFNNRTQFLPNGKVGVNGTFTIPGTASLGRTRMRIITNTSTLNNNPCVSNLFRGETEDYTIMITPNTLPTAANFIADLNSICTGLVTFQDQSTNGATSWQWNFGDGGTSTLQNPAHTYASATPGTYDVTLIACKGTQCDTIVKTNFIHITVPCVSYCASTGHNSNNQWIENVTLGSINYNSGSAPSGYANNTFINTDLILGTSYPYSVTLGTNTATRFVIIWIDFNQDGIFDQTEIVQNSFTSPQPNATYAVTGNLTVPSNASTGRTRMRVMMTPSSFNPDPCATNLFSGEVEDYTVTIQPNNLPVDADFGADFSSICTGVVDFSDLSDNGATSWQWNFGDGNTSTQRNPTHTYQTTTPTNYDVTLIACKNGVCDTITKNSFVVIDVPCLNYCASTGHNNNTQWISNVTAGTINNTSGQNINGYGNYSYLSSSAIIGTTVNFSVTLGMTLARYVNIWVDFNRDGIFQQTEQVFTDRTWLVNGNYVATGSFTIPNTANPGRTRMRISMTASVTFNQNPCATNMSTGEVEDYTLDILPNTLPTTANFSMNLDNICTGVVDFSDLSANGATSWLWNFGDGNTSTQRNPTHTYQTTTPASYHVTLIACKGAQCDTFTISNAVNITNPCNNYCNSAGHNNTTKWISNVTYGTVNNSSGADMFAYANFTYLNSNVVAGTSMPIAARLDGPATINRNIVVWIDFNQDGVFQTNEMMLNQTTTVQPGGLLGVNANITIPFGAATGRTRMRVMMIPFTTNPNPCINSWYAGEVEDYGITILQNNVPPVANYSTDLTSVCTGLVMFRDQSLNGVTSWRWTFGDGTTSTQPNPSHTYTNSGSYPVKLVVCNANSCDSLTTNINVSISTTPVIPASCTPVTATYCCGYGIATVQLNLLNNTSGNGSLGYEDFTCSTIDTLVVGRPYTLQVTNSTLGLNENARAWIDYNNNGVFESTENVMISDNASSHSQTFTVPLTTVKNVTVRMRVSSDEAARLAPTACGNLRRGQVEDYAIYLHDPVGVKEQVSNLDFSVYPNPSEGKFNIDLTVVHPETRLEVVNVLGQVLEERMIGQQDENKTLQLDLTHLPTGVYMIKINSEKATGIRKIVIE